MKVLSTDKQSRLQKWLGNNRQFIECYFNRISSVYVKTALLHRHVHFIRALFSFQFPAALYSAVWLLFFKLTTLLYTCSTTRNINYSCQYTGCLEWNNVSTYYKRGYVIHALVTIAGQKNVKALKVN